MPNSCCTCFHPKKLNTFIQPPTLILKHATLRPKSCSISTKSAIRFKLYTLHPLALTTKPWNPKAQKNYIVSKSKKPRTQTWSNPKQSPKKLMGTNTNVVNTRLSQNSPCWNTKTEIRKLGLHLETGEEIREMEFENQEARLGNWGLDSETGGWTPKLGFRHRHSEIGIGFAGAIREPGLGNRKELGLGSETSKRDSATGIEWFGLMTLSRALPWALWMFLGG